MNTESNTPAGAETAGERNTNDAPRWKKAPKKTSTNVAAPEGDTQSIPLACSGAGSP